MGKYKDFRKWTLSWIILAVGISSTQSANGPVNVPPLTRTISGLSPAHNERVCSTWGNSNFKTYDGDFFQLLSTCNYILTSQCSSSYEDFNVQLRRQVVNGEPLISKITMKLDGTVVELSNGSVSVDGQEVTLPYSHSGVLIETNPTYIKVIAKLGLVAMWNRKDAFLVELDNKYKNQTCGLCGDFNGVQLYNEFIKNGVEISPSDFAQFAKMDAPTESCSESAPPSDDTCIKLTAACEQLLSGPAFSDCKDLISLDYFIKACELDMCQCSGNSSNFCLCGTISEYSRQCVHAGGKPGQWRTEHFCPKTCPYPNMVYQECGNPCINTCSNPDRGQVCEEHCIDGCFCPSGSVLDDLTGRGCIAQDQCSCIHDGEIYHTGQNFTSNCKECTCTSNQWSCTEKDCPGTCSVEGGSHITTFDGKSYNFHGDCTYILAEQTNGAEFVVVGDLVRCGLTTTETCLKAVTLALSAGSTVFNIQPDGKVFLNRIYSQLPLSTAGVNIFRPTTFYIIVQTSFGLQMEIQLVPIMQVYITVDVTHKQNLLGLCGNFNGIQIDDFTTMSGSREGTGVGFANSWRTRATCPEVKNTFENPCSLSVENEKYAQKWCSMLSDPNGVFASCHSEISPDIYQKNCMYDTCNCENSENCMCAALSSYVHACAAKGILLSGWRSEVCMKYATSCPSTMVYTYDISASVQSCRCHSDPDFTCAVTFDPVDGCVCAEGTYLDDNGKCVPLNQCSCYYKGSVIPPAEVISKDGTMCTCKNGKLSCIGSTADEPSCSSPTVFFNCSDATPGSTGSECQKSCNTLDMACISTECVSGCVCPAGLVSDGKGGCIEEALCPCVHNSQIYQPGESIKVDCNTCTCKDRKWQCSTDSCHGTCTVYGDGNYITFDGKRYTFDGDCEYTLVRDNCGHSNTSGTFRVITENIPCGTTGTTCSKAIKLFLGSNELLLTDGGYEVIQRDGGDEIPYQISIMGIYMVIEANNGLILMWDQKTSIFIKLSPNFKGEVCGLCGNYDGNTINDFTLRNQGVVNNALDFGNSWKESSSCPDASQIKNPCTFNPYRQAWAQKQCSIIMNEIFVTCHSHVDPAPYYSACVRDACACDTGGDCECFCTAVAAYAEACNEGGVCVAWRTPKICPLFCDYYNPPDECEWHYKPCGAPCMKTCRNPEGTCSSQLPPLEGCYPKCPVDQPYFDEVTMKCVKKESCGCYYKAKHYNDGDEVPSTQNCQKCYCSSSEINCKTDDKACTCLYDGRIYHYGDTIYNTTDGYGNCITATCGKNGKIERASDHCTTTLPPTTTVFDFSTTVPTVRPSTPVSSQPATTTGPTSSTCQQSCEWSEWLDTTFPTPGTSGGDSETYQNIRAAGYRICEQPSQIQCRAEKYPNKNISEVGQNVECNVNIGLICKNEEQSGPFPLCLNYQIRVYCCDKSHCTSPTKSVPTTIKVTTQTRPHCEECSWTPWMNVDYPEYGPEGGDNETIKNIIKSGRYKVCEKPAEVKCQAVRYPGVPLSELDQNVTCSTSGLLCENKYQTLICLDYEVKAKCCKPIECATTNIPTTTTIRATTTPITTTPTTTTTPPRSTKPPTPPTTTPTSTTPTTTTATTTIITSPTTPPTTTSPTTPTSTTPTTTTTSTPTTPTSTTPTTTTTTTTTPPTTTPTSTTPTTTITTTPHPSCQPVCSWTGWKDFGPPTTGPNGGEIVPIKRISETYPQICSTPSNVECRAKLYPDLSLSQLGQVVTCNAQDGLICLNQNQGLQQQCFDYEINVYCCLMPEGCYSTTTSSTTMTTTTTAPPTTATTSTTFNVITGSTSTPGTGHQCVCIINGTKVPPGFQIYNVSDHDGWCYVAFCNQTEHNACVPHTHAYQCGSTTQAPTTSHMKPCHKPPLKHGETIPDGKCSNITCNNGVIIHEHMKCQDAPLPVCVNNHLPKKVTDESGCCSKYECECICSGFGDPHYITFDGTYYPFQGNCSYVLVKEINPKYHFSVIIDNVYCDSEDGLSCPKSLTVHYKSFKIFMTQDISNGMVINLIKVNNIRVLLPYENEDFRITDNGIESLVVIPAIDAQVTFTGMMFFINLPWQKFHGNTEGQCGTCNNNRTEDCRLPNGTIISSCEKMAPYWHVSNNNSVCPPPNPTPTPVPCTNAPICEILSTTFKECHQFVPYQYYEEACNYDVCHMNTQSIGCSSLQMYAEQCALAGICIDWRPATNGVCEFFCEEPKVYKACGPQIPPTCDLRFNLKFINTPSAFSALESMLWEGCYCPEGMMQLSPDINMCVNSSCDYCLMNDGQLKKAKETWVSGCDSCTCDAKSLTVSCMKLPCPTQKPVKCDALEGQVKVQQIVDCCQYDICVCNHSLCPDEKHTCPLGFTPHFKKKGCCQSHTCVPESVCVFNDTVYQPGASVPLEKCHECVCTHKVDSQTELNKVSCMPVTCNTQCPLGYEYELVPGDCCGQCVQFSCVVTSGNTNQMLKPGETWTPPNDKCVTYSCVKSGTHYYPVTTQHVCQPFFEADCVPGTIVTVDCCPTCILKNRACNLTRNSTYLESNGCRTEKPVELTACEGSCVTSSLYSMAANTFEHSCSCCQEVSTSKKEAEFICPGGTKFTQTYVYVDKCGCYERECTLKEIPPSKQRRRRR